MIKKKKIFVFYSEFSVNGNLSLRVFLVDSRLSWVRCVLSSFLAFCCVTYSEMLLFYS